jgi:hypothetical protein
LIDRKRATNAGQHAIFARMLQHTSSSRGQVLCASLSRRPLLFASQANGIAHSRKLLVTRAQQQPKQRNRFSTSAGPAADKWRWFGFHATACSQQRHSKSEYVSIAVYDLESGDFYSSLINPKLHDPEFRFTANRLKGGVVGACHACGQPCSCSHRLEKYLVTGACQWLEVS